MFIDVYWPLNYIVNFYLGLKGSCLNFSDKLLSTDCYCDDRLSKKKKNMIDKKGANRIEENGGQQKKKKRKWDKDLKKEKGLKEKFKQAECRELK